VRRARAFRNGTPFIVTLPGIEPILGEFFAMNRQIGDSILSDIAAATVAGRRIVVADDGFAEVLAPVLSV